MVRVRSADYLLEVGQSVNVIFSTNRTDVDVSALELTVPTGEDGVEVSGCILTAKKKAAMKSV